jgi:hypothetical protein
MSAFGGKADFLAPPEYFRSGPMLLKKSATRRLRAQSNSYNSGIMFFDGRHHKHSFY